MPLTQTELAQKFKQALDANSNNPNVNTATAREDLANELAEGVAQFVIGRTTTVTGSSATGGAVTGTGTINS